MISRKIKGFTLVEVMVAIFLSTIVLTAIYGVWIRVQREIAKSHARQTLQSELRTASNYLQKDLKSIKEGTFETPGGLSADGTSLHIVFDRFKDTEETKIAQDSIEKVEYRLSDGLLTRKSTTELKILSVNVESMQITKSVDAANLGAGDLESTDEDFKAGREAKLEINIVGRKNIAGSKEEMYHVERTSLVMRDEYYKKTNKNFVSNFDLAKLEQDAVVVTDSTQDASFGPGGAMTEEQLQSLDKDQLEGLEETQNELIDQAKDSIDQMNDSITDTDTGESGWSKFWQGVNVFSTTEGEKVRDLRGDLENADTQSDVKVVLEKLNTYTKDKEEEFLGKSVPGYSTMSDAQKDLYKEAYEMKLQDRTIEGSHQALVAQAEKDGTTPPEAPQKVIDVAIGAAEGEGSKTYEDEAGNTVQISNEASSTRSTTELKSAYDAIDLGWMGEFNKEPDDVGIYNAAKQLISQGKAKLNVIEMRDTSEDNVELIQKVKATK
ncbi:MAG: prepilin-type N-terminal cleavage/methylation domain-containing protein [Candidatus Riflebacteria bacterium]|nr:prepilin-type N-terminal cleavage/methylation domain-containing protein [Candidatus Riflebacteria bacterium]